MKYLKYLLFALLFIPSVNASTFYGDYHEVDRKETDYSDTYKVDNASNKYYHEVYTYSDYIYESSEFLYKSDDCIKKEYALLERPSIIEDRNIEEVIMYKYYNIDDNRVRYIHLENFGAKELILSSINIYDGEKRVIYTVLSTNTTVIDGKLHMYGGTFMLDLKDYYSVKDLSIKMTFYTTSDFSIRLGSTRDIKETFMYFNEKFELSGDDYFEMNINKNNMLLDESNIELFTDNQYNEEYDILVEKYVVYKVKDTICKYYNIEKVYGNKSDYYNKVDNIEKYYERDKIELVDDLVITDINYDLAKLVKSSTGEVIIESNLIDKTGIYDVVFKLNDMVIKQKLVYLKDDTKMNEDIKKIMNEYNSVINSNYDVISKKDKQINDLNNELDKKIKEYENKIINLKSSIESLQTKDVKSSNIKDNILSIDILKISIIFIIFTIILLFAVLAKRIHKKNN